jgi:CheY-like chemotaxis protein
LPAIEQFSCNNTEIPRQNTLRVDTHRRAGTIGLGKKRGGPLFIPSTYLRPLSPKAGSRPFPIGDLLNPTSAEAPAHIGIGFQSPESSAAHVGAGRTPITPIRVLCVDDCPRIRGAWERLLSLQSDMRAVAMLDGIADLPRLCREHGPDVIILDLNLGRGDALQAVRSLLTSLPEARVLIYSGCSEQSVIDQCIEAGVWGYVGKETEPGVVLKAVRQIARGEAVFPPPAPFDSRS